jgi:hypothetical protein
LFIREGRKAARQLTTLVETSKSSGSSGEAISPRTDTMTSMSTVLEQDFTVEGKKGRLDCPFSAKKEEPMMKDLGVQTSETPKEGDLVGASDPTPHHPSDPICAAMYGEALRLPVPSVVSPSSAKCPIRFLDQHSPEEIARYVETHKHEIPRSHEICVRRYQKNEEQIRKLDAKYGSLVGMIKDLSQLHLPMLPAAETDAERRMEVDQASNERVGNWAQDVSAAGPSNAAEGVGPGDADDTAAAEGRESHFDRPLKEVRVGESPSRPWGISVPTYDARVQEQDQRPLSPPPAPVRMPSPLRDRHAPQTATAAKCLFDHTKLFAADGVMPSFVPKIEAESSVDLGGPAAQTSEEPFTPITNPAPPPKSPPPPQPTFSNPPELPKVEQAPSPQIVFNFSGPVFIGYPMEQAVQFMQQFQG